MKTKVKTLLAALMILALALALAACGKSEPAAEETPTEAAQTAKTETAYVYGTLDLSYADFYYGELNDVEENATLQLDAADPVAAAGYRDKGVYDAVSCATTQKVQRFEAADIDDEDGALTIEGVRDVPIAVPQSLYEEATAALKADKTAKNNVLEFVDDLETVSDKAPQEYKVLNGDGTLTAMKSERKTDKKASAELNTSAPWGQFVMSVRGGDTTLPAAPAVYGVVLETSDGEKFGLKHGANIWINPAELSFCTTEGFKEPHGNVISAGYTKDLAGKTITSITYLVKGGTMTMTDRSGNTTTVESDGVDIVVPCELSIA